MNLLFEGLFIEPSEIRDIVRKIISPSILTHRKSTLTFRTLGYVQTGNVTDVEIEDFLLSIPYFDRALSYYLLSDGYIGKRKTTLWVDSSWMEDLVLKIQEWGESEPWLYGELELIYQPGSLRNVSTSNDMITLPTLMQSIFLK